MRAPSKKMLGVTFNMYDSMDKELYEYVERYNFSELVKHLLFTWKYGYLDGGQEKKEVPSPGQKRDIQQSGIPFG